MKLSNEDKLKASIAMLRSDSFTRGNTTMFPFDGPDVYCVLQMIGPADKCKCIITTKWNEAIAAFEEYTGEPR